MQIKLYNTLTRTKEEFNPINDKEVRIYSCGPTVYSYAHIGNFRAYVFMDTIRRVLEYNGYKLKHVMNITDVGHLESDADEGEDKMEKAAKRENKNPYEIAKYYEEIFFRDMKRLNIERPGIVARATEHIPEMLEYVKKLIENGYAYETSKGIYFDISKLDKYPVLSNRNIDEQIAGARVEVDMEKKNPYDFALWIKAPESHIMKWESPWGLSYPGWHLECSAMSLKYLGDEFDIHTGGVDHIPTHHENEIAQSKGRTGKIPAKVWMHVEFLQVDNGKMGKSLGNAYTLDQLQERGIEPLAYKLFCYTAHYRAKLNFTFEIAKSSQIALDRLRNGYLKHLEGTEIIDNSIIEEYKQKFLETINDDLNIPLAMGIVWEIVKNGKKSKQFAELLLEFDKVLGLDLENSKKVNKYYRVTKTTNGTTTTEISKEEATNATKNTASRGASYATTYKNIQISTIPSNITNTFLIDLTNLWLKSPYIKSYDVIAIRTDDATVIEGTQEGTQTYIYKNGSTGTIDYSNNGTNMVKASNGFGISMNLVDDANTYECTIEAIVTATTRWATVYGSYQHAATNVTLAQSKSYTISHNGYGEVINFATAVQNDYDGMQGVSIALDYTA